MAKTYSRTGTSGVTTQKNKSFQKNKNKQTNSSKTDVYNDSTQNTRGGQDTVSYKDLSGLSPNTLALSNQVNNSKGYTPSQAVQNAYGLKQNAENAAANYGQYNSNYQDTIQQTLDKIMNRQPFNYDFNADALYKSYADQYAEQGRQAAQNAAASASALTGGYGNSYAASAASQANQQYMTELNNKIPELYQLAMERYNNETNNLMNQFSILGAQDDREYGRYNDDKQYLMSDRDYYNSNYTSERQADMTNQQNAYDNAMNLLKYYTDLEVKDVTGSTNWSDVTNHDESHTKDKTSNTNTQTSKSNDTSKQNTSNTSVTSSTSTGGGKGYSGKKGNSLTGTDTSQSTISRVMSEFKNRLKANSDPSKTTGYKSSPQLAKEYLYECVQNGTIKKKDFNYIMKVCGVKA